VRTSIIAGVDVPPVLELAEHIFDIMALAIKQLIVGDWPLAVGF
jgi:hypothetical protein